MKAVRHIGISKTSTSATQAMLMLNRACLWVADINHPRYRLRAVELLAGTYLRNRTTPVQTLLRRTKRLMYQP